MVRMDGRDVRMERADRGREAAREAGVLGSAFELREGVFDVVG